MKMLAIDELELTGAHTVRLAACFARLYMFNMSCDSIAVQYCVAILKEDNYVLCMLFFLVTSNEKGLCLDVLAR